MIEAPLLRRLAVLPVLLAVLGARPARADIITLNAGGRVEGTIVSEDEQSIRVETRSGIVHTIAREEIARIEKFADPRAEFARRRQALETDRKPPEAQAWYDLGAWALDRKLEPEAKTAFEKAIAVDPNHAAARARLGFERVGQEWLPFAEAQKRRGLVEYQGRWVTPEERSRLEQGYVLDPSGQWVKKEELEARKAAEEESARKARESEAERAQRAKERAEREKEAKEDEPREAAPMPVLGGPLRIVQFNIRFDFEDDGPNRWSHRAPLVAGLLKDWKAEVACFQEDKTDQVDDLRRLLPGWEFVGMGRNGGFSEHCSIAFDTRRWHALEHGDFWLSDAPEKVGSNTWGTKYPHKVTWAHLESADGRRDFVATSTHLDEHPDREDVRERSAKVIRAWLSQHAAAANLVVCGDFNAGTDESPHAIMLDPLPAPRLVDVWDALRKGDPRTGTCHEFTGTARKKRIDWMFAAGNIVPRAVEIDRWNKDGRYPSDHFALAAELEILPRGKKLAR